MALAGREIDLTDSSDGLATDLPDVNMPRTTALVLKNCDVRNRRKEKLPGTAAYNPSGLPSNIIILREDKFVFTVPSEQEVYLVHGTVSGAHRLYVRPYLNSAGAWVDSWLHLTEAELGLTTDAGTNTTTIVDAGLSSAVDGYYVGWIVHNTSKHGSAIITAYNGSTKTLTLSWQIFEQASGQSYRIMRNPVYDENGNFLLQPDGACNFMKNGNTVAILTGSDSDYRVSPYKTDLELVLINNGEWFNDSDLDFTGFWLTRKHLDPFVIQDRELVANAYSTELTAVANGSDVAITASGYIVLIVPVYHGSQEAPIEPGIEPFDGTKYPLFNRVTIGANQKLTIAFTPNCGLGTSEVESATPAVTATPTTIVGTFAGPNDDMYVGFYVENITRGAFALITDYNSGTDTVTHETISGQTTGDSVRIVLRYEIPIKQPQKNAWPLSNYVFLDRRIERFNIYMATSQQDEGYDKPTEAFRFVKFVSLNDDGWTGLPTIGGYSLSVTITGADYTGAVEKLLEDRQGYSAINVFANAKYGRTVINRTFYANVFADQNRSDFIFYSPVNSDGVNCFDLIPHTIFTDGSLYGLGGGILGIFESFGIAVIVSRDGVLRISPSSLSLERSKQQRGATNENAIARVNELIYLASLEDVYVYHGGQDVFRSILLGHIRDEWQALSLADRQAAAIGYDRRYEMLVVTAGARIYLYNLPKVTADALAADTQAIGAWHQYDVPYTFVRFFTDTDGACIGVTNDGQVRELLADSPTDSTQMIFESPVIQGPLNLEQVRMIYDSDVLLTAEFYDVSKSAAYPKKTLTFYPQATRKPRLFYPGALIELLKVKLFGASGTTKAQNIYEFKINPVAVDRESVVK